MGERRLGVLDGLRGIAVLMVLWYHVWEVSWLPAPSATLQFVPETGFVGVHLFFFLSGFVISYPFIRAVLAGAKPLGWGQFAWRRFIKIVPSYVLSIGIAFAIGYAATQTSGNTPADVIAHLLFVHTWFPQTYGAINGVLWTLAVEVEFYLLFPLLWWCFARSPWTTSAAMIALAVASRHVAVSCCHQTLMMQLEENLPGYLDLFAFGMISAYVYARFVPLIRLAISGGLATLVALAGFALLAILLADLWAGRTSSGWPFIWQADNRSWLGFAFAVIATASLASAPWWQAALGNPILKFLALISYNLYLYHQIVARELLWHHLPPYPLNPHIDRLWQVTYTVDAFAVSIGIAALLTFAFERPLMRIRDPSSMLARLRALYRGWRSKSAERL